MCVFSPEMDLYDDFDDNRKKLVEQISTVSDQVKKVEMDVADVVLSVADDKSRAKLWEQRLSVLEKRIRGNVNSKLTFVDRTVLDDFVKESARLSLKEGELKMEELNWNVKVMMKKLRSFYSDECHQGSAFWFSFAASRKYFNNKSSNEAQLSTSSYGSIRGSSFRQGFVKQRGTPYYRGRGGIKRSLSSSQKWFD
jgi:hypothetical protein